MEDITRHSREGGNPVLVHNYSRSDQRSIVAPRCGLFYWLDSRLRGNDEGVHEFRGVNNAA